MNEIDLFSLVDISHQFFMPQWQSAGFSSVIYIAALASVSPEQHEAAVVDGASKLQRIRHIDIPTILPTAIILLILNMGQIMSVGCNEIVSV